MAEYQLSRGGDYSNAHLRMQQPTTSPEASSSATKHANWRQRLHRCCARLQGWAVSACKANVKQGL